jgi:hypothetical protein
MASITFIFDHHDQSVLVDFLCRCGYSLACDRWEGAASPSWYTKPDELLQVVAPYHTVHLFRSDYARCPLDVRPLSDKDDSEGFFIMPRNGGPTILLNLSAKRTSSGQCVLTEGSVHHYPWYWNTSALRNEKASTELKAAYRQIVAFIKAGSMPAAPSRAFDKSQSRGRVTWVGPHTAAIWNSGDPQLLPAASTALLKFLGSWRFREAVP